METIEGDKNSPGQSPVVTPLGQDGQAKHADRYVFGVKQFDTYFAEVFRGTDNQTNKPVSLHVFRNALSEVAEARVEAALLAVQNSSAPSIAHPVEFRGGESPLLVTDFIEGHTVRQLIERKRKTGTERFSPRGTRNIVTQLITALREAKTPHGALSIDAITIDKAGHLLITDFGLWPLLQDSGAGDAGAATFAAPELAKGEPATAASDAFGIGNVLYEILMGTPPVSGCPRPSETLGLSQDIDKVIGACTSANPSQRPNDFEKLSTLISKALVGNPSDQSNPSASQARRKKPQVSLAQRIGQGSAPVQANAEEERWLVTRDKLDYGPYTTAGLLEQISISQARGEHQVTDSFTGERVALVEHPLFTSAVEKASEERVSSRRADAEVVEVARGKRRDRAVWGTVLAGIAALGLAGFGVFTILRKDSNDSQAAISVDEDDFGIKIGGAKNIADGPSKRRNGRRNSGNKNLQDLGGPANSNSEAWDSAVDFGDVSKGGGDERLSDAQVNRALQSQSRALSRCMASSPDKNAAVRFIVRGSGSISYVGVNGSTSSPLARCVSGAVRKMSFPSFDGVRDRRTFTISR